MFIFSILIVILIISIGIRKSYGQTTRKKCITWGKSIMIGSYFITVIITNLSAMNSNSPQPGWDAAVIATFTLPIIFLVGLAIFLVGLYGMVEESD